ncbi:DUF3883 domain-containing protein [Bacillus wiedmannii]
MPKITKNVFIKYHEKNEDYPNVASTMAAHENVARLGNGDFVWGQFTTRKNQSGISLQPKIKILEQLRKGEITYVYFYSRVGEVLYRAELVDVYNNDDPLIFQPSFQELVPSYYRHLCGQTQINEQTKSIIYAYFHVRNLELIAEGKANVASVATKICHYEKGNPILEVRGMQALLYVRDEGVDSSIRKLEITEIEKKVKTKKIILNPPKSIKDEAEERVGLNDNDDFIKVARKINYEESSKKKRYNGLLSESIVIDFEKENLLRNGKHELANKIEHVSIEKGDGVGYDIKSYTIDGIPKYIEVKGTTNKNDIPFFISFSEVRASKYYGEKYYIYRVFDIEGDTPCIDKYQGDVSENFELQEYTFIAKRKY